MTTHDGITQGSHRHELTASTSHKNAGDDDIILLRASLSTQRVKECTHVSICECMCVETRYEYGRTQIHARCGYTRVLKECSRSIKNCFQGIDGQGKGENVVAHVRAKR